jgi:hypothetical protein
MGGLVARKFLVERAVDLMNANVAIGSSLWLRHPSDHRMRRGSLNVASLFGHAQADTLRFQQSNTWLNGLDKEFQKLK